MEQCALLECDTPRHKREWCNKHYLRWYKHGDPRFEPTRHSVCIVDGCDQVPKSTGKGLCEKHRARVRTHGDPHKVIRPTRRLDITYNSAHRRVHKDLGSAKAHRCVDCGEQAQQWAYNHQDPNQLIAPEGWPYSPNPAFYEPRCAPCHVSLDRCRERA